MAMPVVTADLGRWEPLAREAPAGELKLSKPLHVFLDEAVELAKALERRWEPVVEDGRDVLPGLSSVAGKGLGALLHAGLGEDLRSLQRAVSAADTNYQLVRKLAGSPTERGHFVLRELRSGLSFLFSAQPTSEGGAHVAALGRAHESQPPSQAALALAIEAYAELAKIYRAELENLGTFSPEHIDAAPALALELRERTRAPTALSGDSTDALSLRDRLGRLLLERLNAVRASARFVFRNHPDIAREFTSDYDRRRRNAARDVGEPDDVDAEVGLDAESEVDADGEVEFAES